MFVLDEDKKEERGHGPLYLYLSGSVLENTLEFPDLTGSNNLVCKFCAVNGE